MSDVLGTITIKDVHIIVYNITQVLYVSAASEV